MQTDMGRDLQSSCSDESYGVCVLLYDNWDTAAVSDKSTDGRQNAKSTQPFQKTRFCEVRGQGQSAHYLTNLLRRETRAEDELRMRARPRF